MSAPSWLVITLLVAGGVLEVGGVLLVLVEITRRRAALRAFEAGRAVHHVRAVGDTLTTSDSVTVTGGRPPTLEERVERLESGERARRDELQQTEQRLHASMEGKIRSGLEATERTFSDRLVQLRDLLITSVSGHALSYASVACLLSGLVLQAASGVLSALN